MDGIPELLKRWCNSGVLSGIASYNYKATSSYLFSIQRPQAPLIAVRGLLGITTTYPFSPVAQFADRVVCDDCWTQWIATPPWNDTPPTLKIPPTCVHLEAATEDGATS